VPAERKKVLELLAEGKINSDEAEKLLNTLDSLSRSTDSAKKTSPPEAKPAESKPLSYLRFEVEKPGTSEIVNVRIPLSRLRISRYLQALLPERLLENLSANGIDVAALSALSLLRGPERENILKQLHARIDNVYGKQARFFYE